MTAPEKRKFFEILNSNMSDNATGNRQAALTSRPTL